MSYPLLRKLVEVPPQLPEVSPLRLKCLTFPIVESEQKELPVFFESSSRYRQAFSCFSAARSDTVRNSTESSSHRNIGSCRRFLSLSDFTEIFPYRPVLALLPHFITKLHHSLIEEAVSERALSVASFSLISKPRVPSSIYNLI